ncbi:unnamed protein product [Bursaphelenchus okinawaensis]|uniref:PDZ domain-containing protein n=1 Tax=Bursaphelenchus okinawaensis TaxID=465554 RepID=A0A811JRY0_9BILA|nr:unnamed protein product [Bursaphelenchus okinawaensis]CAG9080100.1 unnamed protein product [Bursaphelenchus okinawaensis]
MVRRNTEDVTQDCDENMTAEEKKETGAKLHLVKKPRPRKIKSPGRKKRSKSTTVEDDITTQVTEDENEELSLDDQLKRELAMGLPMKKHVISFDYEPGTYMGFKLNDKCVITEVDQRPNVSPFWDILKVGDVILQINTHVVMSQDDFYSFLGKTQGPKCFHVNRVVPMKEVSQNRRRRLKIDKYDGDKYFTAYITAAANSKLGITVKSNGFNVALTKVEEWSAGYGVIDIGDLILDVNGVPVKDAETTKSLLSQSMKKNGFVTCVCCRAMTMKSLERAREALGPQACAPEDYVMRPDAALIGRMEAMRIRRHKANKKKRGVYRKTPNKKKQNITLNTKHNKTLDIMSDVEDFAQLARVPPVHHNNSSAKEKVKNTFRLLFDPFF